MCTLGVKILFRFKNLVNVCMNVKICGNVFIIGVVELGYKYMVTYRKDLLAVIIRTIFHFPIMCCAM